MVRIIGEDWAQASSIRGRRRDSPGACPVCGVPDHACVGDAEPEIEPVELPADLYDPDGDMVMVKHDVYAVVTNNSTTESHVLLYRAGSIVTRKQAEANHARYTQIQRLSATEVK